MTATLAKGQPALPFGEPVQSIRHAVTIAGRRLEVTPVFDTYWRFAAARHHIYESRQAGAPGPWTNDPILRSHRFTNCFRAADRVSQFLIREVAYRGSGPAAVEGNRSAASSGRASKRIRALRRTMSRNKFVVIRCSQPSKVPGENCDKDRNTRTNVSWVRSSASARLPDRR